jgi:hypothetical protein
MHARHTSPRALFLGLPTLLIACATAQQASPVMPPTRLPYVTESEGGPAGIPVASASVPRAVRRAVVADAARRFKVDESAVVLVRAEQVTWPDASLGCPEPGMAYTQMLVAGFRIVAKTTEGELTYHADERGRIALCGR